MEGGKEGGVEGGKEGGVEGERGRGERGRVEELLLQHPIPGYSMAVQKESLLTHHYCCKDS